MPTFGFVLYLLLLAAIVFFRLSYLGWFGPYIVAAAIALPLLLLLLSLPAMLRLRLNIGARPWVYRGDEGSLELRFSGRGVMPISKVVVKLEMTNRFTTERVRKQFVFRCVAGGSRQIALPTGLCGMLSCRVLSYEAYDALGLFKLRRKLDAVVDTAVIPRPAADFDSAIFSALNARQRLKPKYGGGYSEEHDLREYQPGDTVNSIHWKLSSKTDKVIVREPLVRENDSIYLVLAAAGTNDEGLEKLYRLSLELLQMELSHYIIADRAYEVYNEQEAMEAMRSLLSVPLGEPCGYDEAMARCVFIVNGEEVRSR